MQGLVMATRAGDIDVALIDVIMREQDLDFTSVLDLLQHRSGLLGLCGTDDMRQVRARADNGDEEARRAIDVYVHRLIHYIGAYVAQLPDLDALVFTGGVGEHDVDVRRESVESLGHLGFALSEDRNRRAIGVQAGETRDIGAPGRRPRVLVVGADEERRIAEEVWSMQH